MTTSAAAAIPIATMIGLARASVVLGGFGQPAPAHEDGGSQPGRDIAEHQWDLLEQPEDAEQLGDQDQHREPDHDLRQARQRPRPGGHEQGSQVVGA